MVPQGAGNPAQVRELVERALEDDPEARAVAVKIDEEWSGPEELEVGEERFPVRWARSPLEARDHLLWAESEDRRVVLVTPLADQQELGGDVVGRLARHKVYSLHPWELVKNRFGVQTIDPRLLGRKWMAPALLEASGAGEAARRTVAGTLDEGTAFKALFRDALGPSRDRPDLRSLLEWTLIEGALERHRQLKPEVREGLREWVVDQTRDPMAKVIFGMVEAGHGRDAVPLGLVAEVLFHRERHASSALRDAAIRLEQYTGREEVDPDAGGRWARTASDIVDTQEATGHGQSAERLRERADQLLRELRAEPFAHLSEHTREGLEGRLTRFGQALEALIDADPRTEARRDALADLEQARKVAVAHRRLGREAARRERVEMALRLARWLTLAQERETAAEAAAADLETEVARYVEQGAFVDRARAQLANADSNPGLGRAVTRLLEAAAALCEARNERFVAALVREGLVARGDGGGRGGASGSGRGGEGGGARAAGWPVPVEDVLGRVVAPLAERTGVLVVVVDGMSQAIFRELLDDVERSFSWVRVRPQGFARTPAALTAFPSTTEVCRTSLLSGTLTRGTSQDELRAFAQSPALAAVSDTRHRPALFHKSSLLERGRTDLSEELRSAVAESKRRVVGSVFNAVDDHLSGSDQLDVRWTLDRISGLVALLDAARQAGRAVVLTADHGHLIDRGSSVRPGGGEHDPHDRYRPVTGTGVGAGEVVLRGERVLVGGEEGIVAAWSERLRYAGRKHGYHGGASPQEAVVPLAVLMPAERGADELEGWVEEGDDTPAWWNEALELESVTAAPAAPTAAVAGMAGEAGPEADQVPAAHRERSAGPRQGAGTTVEPGTVGEAAAPGEAAAAAARGEGDWIEALLASPVYAEQRKLGGRQHSDERVREVLRAMDRLRGQALLSTVARELGRPPVRVRFLIPQVGKVLNVDGYAVLEYDAGEETVRLDRELAIQQFGLAKE